MEQGLIVEMPLQIFLQLAAVDISQRDRPASISNDGVDRRTDVLSSRTNNQERARFQSSSELP